MINWGDVPTWLGAIGTIGAVFWAVYLYRGSLRDSERAQARLLSPIRTTKPVVAGRGATVALGALGDPKLFQQFADRSLAQPAYRTNLRIVSTADEAFSGVQAWLIRGDGQSVPCPLPSTEIAPHDDWRLTVYFSLSDIDNEAMRVRLRFQDASGRWWERESGKPVRRSSKPIEFIVVFKPDQSVASDSDAVGPVPGSASGLA